VRPRSHGTFAAEPYEPGLHNGSTGAHASHVAARRENGSHRSAAADATAVEASSPTYRCATRTGGRCDHLMKVHAPPPRATAADSAQPRLEFIFLHEQLFAHHSELIGLIFPDDDRVR
jgi:hypothetical protein